MQQSKLKTWSSRDDLRLKVFMSVNYCTFTKLQGHHPEFRMTTTTSNIVFDDLFTINAIDKDGRKFDRGAWLVLNRSAKPLVQISVICSIAALRKIIKLWHGPDLGLQ